MYIFFNSYYLFLCISLTNVLISVWSSHEGWTPVKVFYIPVSRSAKFTLVPWRPPSAGSQWSPLMGLIQESLRPHSSRLTDSDSLSSSSIWLSRSRRLVCTSAQRVVLPEKQSNYRCCVSPAPPYSKCTETRWWRNLSGPASEGRFHGSEYSRFFCSSREGLQSACLMRPKGISNQSGEWVTALPTRCSWPQEGKVNRCSWKDPFTVALTGQELVERASLAAWEGRREGVVAATHPNHLNVRRHSSLFTFMFYEEFYQGVFCYFCFD